MGLLDQLWDDTVAGPPPDNGLGKLRKHSTFTFRPSSAKESDGGSVRSYGDETPHEATRVTRSIMIVKPPGYQTGSPPVSPAGSTPPVSPFSGNIFFSLTSDFDPHLFHISETVPRLERRLSVLKNLHKWTLEG
ncbi:Dormancy/auxin associated family protein isoform 2 [Hibiscus syriacus]|uniref:Dormancy/auxin associated family protein isoform 2 n=1 Tax=Hibiscus syriacus TaxID=106335 RepID=A0A6A2YJN8_HIBSY|nr:Dormancy/auxin associated family protein isoform 2 [Hibiscus syriacus]